MGISKESLIFVKGKKPKEDLMVILEMQELIIICQTGSNIKEILIRVANHIVLYSWKS